MRVVWTEPAIRDLAAARHYIANDNPSLADRQIGRIIAAVAHLAEFPEAGRPGRRLGTRELVVSRSPYLVAYRLRGNMIEILRVLHGSQRWPESF
jgi:toxin ParE1/3/4